MIRTNLEMFVALFIVLSCNKAPDQLIVNNTSKDPFIIIDYDLSDLKVAEEFEVNNAYGGILQSTLLDEASGLAVSSKDAAVLWSHNDSGHPNRLYAVGSKGENLGYFSITGAGSRDYEDICMGYDPENNVDYIYLGDIGDNHAQYNFVVIYRIKEPETTGLFENGVYAIPAENVERFEFTYPDGPRDAETLMFDPWTKDLYVVSKRDFRSIVYRAKYPFDVNKRTELERLAQLPFNWAVAGDISKDGTQIAIKDKHRIYYWTRKQNESVIDALQKKPKLLPYILEPQGESFAWSSDGNGYFTVSEQSGVFPPDLYYYERK